MNIVRTIRAALDDLLAAQEGANVDSATIDKIASATERLLALDTYLATGEVATLLARARRAEAVMQGAAARETALLKRLEFLEQDSDHQRSIASQVPYHKEKREQAEAEAEHLREALRDVLAALGSIPDDDIARGIDKDLAEKNPRRVYYEYDMEMLRIPLRGCRKDKACLETQVAELHGKLEQAVAREAVLTQALEIVWKARESAEYVDFIETGVIGWVFYLDIHKSNTIRDALRDRNATAAALLEQAQRAEVVTDSLYKTIAALTEKIAEQENITTDLHAALQAALAPLEAAADALVPPGRRVEEAQALVDEALTMIHEELE